jgi:hypothetical protein
VQGQDVDDFTLTEEQQEDLTNYFEHVAWVNVLLTLDKDAAPAALRGKTLDLETGWEDAYSQLFKVCIPKPTSCTHARSLYTFLYTFLCALLY